MRNVRIALAALLFLTFSSNAVFACGPFRESPIFEFTKHPDYPLTGYAAGNIGIIEPKYARSYLFIAYRQMNGGDVTALEAAKLDQYWLARIRGEDDALANGAEKSLTPAESLARWETARKKVLTTEAPISTDKGFSEGYGYYKNCLPNAFVSAAATLEKRAAQYGAESAAMKNWTTAQDAVFNNCGETATTPEAAPSDAPAWLKKDRAYQIAAAQFYAMKFAAARQAFEQIAADTSSEWQKTADFVVARTFLREASFQPEAQTAARDALFEKAAAHFDKILNNPAMSEFHLSARRLQNKIKNNLKPEVYRQALPEKLLQTTENPNLQWEVSDYTYLLDDIEAAATDAAAKSDEADKLDTYENIYFKYLPATARENDLTDWIFTFQAVGGFDYARDKWRDTNKVHWLAAALAKAEKDSPNVAELIADAAKVQPASPAFATVAYHQTRLLLEQNQRAAAKQKLNEIYAADFKKMPLSAQNQFAAQRAIVAANLNEYLRYAVRQPVAITYGDDGNQAGDDFIDEEGKPITEGSAKWKNRLLFDTDATKFLNNKVSLATLREAALDKNLPQYARDFLVLAVWTRAFVLKNDKIEREFAPLVLRAAPEYQPLFSKVIAAANPAEREAAALNAILRYPKFEPYIETGFGRADESEADSIDSNRGNWWCVPYRAPYEWNYEDNKPIADKLIYPNFLTAAQTSTAATEQKTIAVGGSSSTYLARRAVEFAAKNPNHVNTPEILHLAVRSTRYGCSDTNTEKFSKAAFNLLRQKYPKNAWTKKTPFWFG